MALLADPTVPGKVWATQGDSAYDVTHIFIKSTDYGATWTQTGSGTLPSHRLGLPNWAACGLAVDPNSPSSSRTLYITMNGNVYRSTNDGASFSNVLTTTVSRTAVDMFNSNYVYAGGDAGMYRSTNGGYGST